MLLLSSRFLECRKTLIKSRRFGTTQTPRSPRSSFVPLLTAMSCIMVPAMGCVRHPRHLFCLPRENKPGGQAFGRKNHGWMGCSRVPVKLASRNTLRRDSLVVSSAAVIRTQKSHTASSISVDVMLKLTVERNAIARNLGRVVCLLMSSLPFSHRFHAVPKVTSSSRLALIGVRAS